MKKISIYILAIGLLVGCTDNLKDATDFTSVTNPNLDEAAIIGKENSATIWLSGLRRQTSNLLNEAVMLAELGSDNYVNTQTFFDQFLDGLEIRTDDPEISQTQFAIARLRVMSKFGIESVGPNDPAYDAATEAEFNFFEGLSYLYAAMYFSALPQEDGGAPVSAADNYASAIASFDIAIAANPQAQYHLAKARANYYLGNQAEAVASANAALALDDDFLNSIQFDELNNPDNTFEDALYERATFDDLQPLPTLDFLDPKYSRIDANDDAPIHILKAEEAYLILAEAALADNNIAGARTNLTSLLTLIASREVREIDDSIEGRPDASSVFPARPKTTNVVVNGRPGLVLDRQAGDVMIPSVSGTSLVQGDVDALTAADDATLALLYRTRQEVFIAEGIRFADMGVKLVIHDNEILQNPNISDGDPSTVAVIPPFIDAIKGDLDTITFTEGGTTATTAIDLNAILVANKTSNQVLPFH
ncbi:hypothetical protein D1816_22110 [Aquimarina sp. AD10]|uniref:hypothetical protein n=1 Tax=Aquimarina sp. AD10 TaxID=1714849 RepID=UPI000E48DC3F|nr:hypothetical protein [Aquimarina sp. AD10]AXT62918.1 hypothetical protein D1816_22110 [Aquimarina sp. AD10]RKM94635.1 hypothetical protein D7033_18290 [Aquimarina sp. AD10]